jgi:hypothetical protein
VLVAVESGDPPQFVAIASFGAAPLQYHPAVVVDSQPGVMAWDSMSVLNSASVGTCQPVGQIP